MRASEPVMLAAAKVFTGELTVELLTGLQMLTPGDEGALHAAPPTVKVKSWRWRRLSTSAAKNVALCAPGAKVELKLKYACWSQVWCCSLTFLPSTQSSILRSWPKEFAAALNVAVEPLTVPGEHTLKPRALLG